MCSHPVSDLTEFLRGEWDLHRDITDGTGVGMGVFTGVGVFVMAEGGLRYEESGQLRLDSYRGTASRTLFYMPDGPSRCTVWFEDGHFFHDLRLDDGGWQAGHQCRSDYYDGSFEVLDRDRWRQHWTVSGPRKAYSMTTHYTRRDGGARVADD